MSRVLVRRVSAMIVVIVLAFVALPIADARPLAGPHPTVGTATSWIAALSTWMSNFFLGTPAKTAAPMVSTRAASSTTYPGGIMQINTGSCIDPDGKPVPCNPNH